MGVIYVNDASDYYAYLRCDSEGTARRLLALYFVHDFGSVYGSECGYGFYGADDHPVLQTIPEVTADLVAAIANEAKAVKRESMLQGIIEDYEVMDVHGRIGAVTKLGIPDHPALRIRNRGAK